MSKIVARRFSRPTRLSASSTNDYWSTADSPPPTYSGELGTVEREIRTIIGAIKAGVPPLSIKDELEALETRKAALTLASAETPLPALHPQMAEVFRQKATALAAGLEHDERRDAARQALRGFVEKIVIPAGDALLQVVGNFGEMLAAAQSRSLAKTAVGYVGCGGPQPSIPTALYVVAA